MQKFQKPILVTRPFLPPLDEFSRGLREIWDNQWLTNNGPVLQRYTRKLSNYFQTDNLSLFNNGTLALQIALQGMGITGEVITTPFTFVATTHALYWNKIRPVFVDIEPDYYTIDPRKVEQAITPRTTAILAVHVFGYPCRYRALADIARRYNLALIYDAAHAFGVRQSGKPIGNLGDISMFSFHATKLYHSLEGGMLLYKDQALKQKFDYLRNLGFKSETQVDMPGTNARMNEFQALMGEQVLEYMDEIISRRKKLDELYRQGLEQVPGIGFSPDLPGDVQPGYAYVPVRVDKNEFGMSRDDLYTRLKDYNIFSRRYFYPLLCDFACYRHLTTTDPLTTARRVADQILTLPIYSDLAEDDVVRICEIIRYIGTKVKG